MYFLKNNYIFQNKKKITVSSDYIFSILFSIWVNKRQLNSQIWFCIPSVADHPIFTYKKFQKEETQKGYNYENDSREFFRRKFQSEKSHQVYKQMNKCRLIQAYIIADISESFQSHHTRLLKEK